MKQKDRFRVVAFTNPGGTQAWRVVGYKPGGLQVRLNFKTYAEALGKKNELEVEALNLPVTAVLRHTRLNDAQLTEAEAAYQKLDGRSLLDAVDFYVQHAEDGLARLTVAEAHREFLAAIERRDLRKRTKLDYRSRLGRLVKGHGGHVLSHLKAADLTPLMEGEAGQCPVTFNQNRRDLFTFFKWCFKRGYTLKNPVASIEPALTECPPPEIWNNTQAKTVLWAAVRYKQGVLVPYFALGLLGGLRPNELARIAWTAFRFDRKEIDIDQTVAKLRQVRIVTMSDNLIQFLRPYVGKPIVGKNWRRDFDGVRRLAGCHGASCSSQSPSALSRQHQRAGHTKPGRSFPPSECPRLLLTQHDAQPAGLGTIQFDGIRADLSQQLPWRENRLRLLQGLDSQHDGLQSQVVTRNEAKRRTISDKPEIAVVFGGA